MQVNFPKKCINCAINDTINCHWLVLILRLYWHGGINLSPSVCSPQDGLMNRYERLRRSCSLWRQEKCRKFAAKRVDNYNLNWVPSVIPSVAGNCAYLEWAVDDTDRTAEVIWSRVSWTRLCKSSWGGDNNQQKSTNRPDTKCKAEETSSARSSRALFWGSGVRYAISILTLFYRLIIVYDDQLGVCIGILDDYYLTEKRLVYSNFCHSSMSNFRQQKWFTVSMSCNRFAIFSWLLMTTVGVSLIIHNYHLLQLWFSVKRESLNSIRRGELCDFRESFTNLVGRSDYARGKPIVEVCFWHEDSHYPAVVDDCNAISHINFSYRCHY